MNPEDLDPGQRAGENHSTCRVPEERYPAAGEHPQGDTEPQAEREAKDREPPGGGGDEKAGKRERRAKSWRRWILETAILVVIAAVIALLIQAFLLRTFVIPTSSMVPTLEIGDRVMAERVTCYLREPRRGDIVVFRYPPAEPGSSNTSNKLYWPFERIAEVLRLAHRGSETFVKRVIATGGETVELRKGNLYVDGKKIDEPYAVKDNSDYGPAKVPKGMLFLLGDNRPNSRDSRYWGFAPLRSVIGKVFLRWWPPSRFGVPR